MLTKILMTKVKNIMSVEVPTLKKEANAEEAAKLLTKEENRCVVVVEDNMPIGIVTRSDFVGNLILSGKDFVKGPVSKIMSSPVTFLTTNMKLDEALKIIDTKRFRVYPVMENEKLVGFVTKNQVVHAVSDNMKFHRNIQNIVLMIFVLFELFIFISNSYG